MTKLTPELLLALGFLEVQPDSYQGKKRLFRFTVPKHETKGYYFRQFQVSIGEYPETNPNSGAVSLYSPQMQLLHFDSEPIGANPSKFAEIDYADSEQQYGVTWITVDPVETPIAHHVTTLERLNAIYTALTENEPFNLPI